MDKNCTQLGSISGVRIASIVLSVVTGFLSVLGCALIMFTHIAYKSLRTKGRAMLFHLSVADLIIVLSHMVGLWNYKRFISAPEKVSNSNRDALCVSQGAFTMFGTVSSLLWSNAIGLFMLVLIVNSSLKSERMKQVFYVVSCMVCWAVPAAIVVVDAALHYFGFRKLGTADCYIITAENTSISKLDVKLAEIFSYEIWACLTFIMLPILYIAMFCYTRCIIMNRVDIKARAKGLELKLLMVPVLFLLLRVWSAILSAISYLKNEDSQYECHKVSAILLFLNSVGVNGQGFANAILFCVFTHPVRKKLKNTLYQGISKLINFISCTRQTDEHKEDFLLSTSVNEDQVVWSGASMTYNSINS